MTEISNERLAEMIAGLEGVTPGPWLNVPSMDKHEMLICEIRQVDSAPTDKHHYPFRVAQTVPGQWANADRDNFEHIARCDPGTMRSVLTELLSLRNAQSEAVVKALLHHVHKMLGYHIVSPPTPDHQFVNVCNGDLRLLAELFEAAALTHPAPPLEPEPAAWIDPSVLATLQAGPKHGYATVYRSDEAAGLNTLDTEAPVALYTYPEAVAVKALKWDATSYGKPEAISVAGTYRVTDAWDGGFNVNRGQASFRGQDGRKNFPTIEAAKAAAQADFDARIRSTLTHPTPSLAVTDAMVSRAAEVHWAESFKKTPTEAMRTALTAALEAKQ